MNSSSVSESVVLFAPVSATAVRPDFCKEPGVARVLTNNDYAVYKAQKTFL